MSFCTHMLVRFITIIRLSIDKIYFSCSLKVISLSKGLAIIKKLLKRRFFIMIYLLSGVYGHPLALPALPTAVAAEAEPAEEVDAKKVVLPIIGHPAYPYGYPAVPYGYPSVPHLLGKREAEAEAEAAPEAEADAWYGRGYYQSGLYSGHYGYPGYLGYPTALPYLPTVDAAEAKPAEEADAKAVAIPTLGHHAYPYGYPILGNRYYGGYGTRGYYYG